MEAWGAAIYAVSVSNEVLERGGGVLGEENSPPAPVHLTFAGGARPGELTLCIFFLRRKYVFSMGRCSLT